MGGYSPKFISMPDSEWTLPRPGIVGARKAVSFELMATPANSRAIPRGADPLALAAAFSGGRSSRKKIIALLSVALGASVLWLASRDGLLVGAFVLLAVGALFVAALLVQLRRRSVAEVQVDQRAAQERTDTQAFIDNIVAHLDLDRQLRANPALAGDRAIGAAPRIVRTPMSTGMSSHFLNKVHLTYPDGPEIKLVEKGVDGDSDELRFWREERRPELILRTDRCESLEPVAIVPDSVVSVMYFPYLPGLDRDRKALRHHFRANMTTIVSAVAELNGRNLVEPSHERHHDPLRFDLARPTVAALQRRLRVSKDSATTLLKSWDDAHGSWEAVSDAYDRLPKSLCHNDVSPWNAVHVDGVTKLSDFGLAGVGPVGSDLHTIIRWSGKAIEDNTHVEGLLRTYLDVIRPFVHTLSLQDVRLAAWATFFLRYTNLKFSSARHLHSYRLALHRMSELIYSYT